MDSLEKRRKELCEELAKIETKITAATLEKEMALKEKSCVKVVCDTCYGLGDCEEHMSSTNEPCILSCHACGGVGYKYEIPFTGIGDYEETFDKLFNGER